jgi:hypothetical protein
MRSPLKKNVVFFCLQTLNLHPNKQKCKINKRHKRGTKDKQNVANFKCYNNLQEGREGVSRMQEYSKGKKRKKGERRKKTKKESERGLKGQLWPFLSFPSKYVRLWQLQIVTFFLFPNLITY